jgi:hypothetical protein
MADNKRKGDMGVLTDDQFETDPNPGIPAGSAGGGLVEPGKTDIGSAPLGSGGAHANRGPASDEMVGGPRAIDYNDEGES